MKFIFNAVIAGVGTAFAYIFGDWDAALIILVVFMAVDYTTGVLTAVVNHKLSSSVGFKGLAKKSCILLVIIAAALLDRLTDNSSWTFRTMSAYFYIANEGISIIENVSNLGVPVPDKLKSILSQLTEK